MGFNYQTEPALIAPHDIKARITIPFLRCFKADWATEAYLHRSLRNRKGYLRRMTVGVDVGATLNDGPDSADDEADSSNEAGDK